MPTISIDSSDLKRLERDLERIQAKFRKPSPAA